MNCLNCGAPVDPTKKFCQVCGYPVEAAPAYNGDAPSEFADVPFSQNPAPAYTQAPEFGQPAAPAYNQQSAPAAKAPKKFNLGKNALIPIVAVILVIVLALSSSAIYTASKPQIKIASALEKTLFSAESFNLEVEIEGETLGEGYVAFGKTTFTSDFYADVGMAGVEVVCNDGNLVVNFGGNCVEVSLPDAFATVQSELDEIISTFNSDLSAEEIVEMAKEEYGVEITPEQVMDWAENLVKNKKLNEDVIKDIYNEVGVYVIAKELEIDVKEVPTYKEVKKIITGAVTKGINGDGFEVTDKNSKDGVKYYNITLHPGELYISMVEYILDCKQLEGVFESEMGEEAREDFENNLEELKEAKEDDEEEFLENTGELDVTIGIDGGYLVYFEIEDRIAITLSEINKKHDAEEDYNSVVDDAEAHTKVDLDNIDEAINAVEDMI